MNLSCYWIMVLPISITYIIIKKLSTAWCKITSVMIAKYSIDTTLCYMYIRTRRRWVALNIFFMYCYMYVIIIRVSFLVIRYVIMCVPLVYFSRCWCHSNYVFLFQSPYHNKTVISNYMTSIYISSVLYFEFLH